VDKIKGKPTLLRMTTVPMSLRYLLTGQMAFMKDKGFNVHMASASGNHLKEALENEKVTHHVLPFKRDISIINDIKALFKTIHLLRKIKPTIVHTHTPKAALIGMLAAKITGVPLRIHTVAGMPLESMTGLKKKIVLNTEKLTYLAATHIWPNSPSLQDYIIKNQYTTNEKLSVIGKGSSNGIDLEDYKFSTLQKSILEEIKRKIDFSEGKKYMLFVGRLVSQKGIVELIDAFKQINHSFPSWRLVLVGPFENDRDPVPESTKIEIEKNQNIISVGFSDKVKYYLSLAELVVFPSHREGFPNVPIQAGAMLCPVIASNIMGNVDIIKDNKTGILFKSKNVEDLKDKITFAINNPEYMKTLAHANFQRINKNFTREFVQTEIYNKYLELLNE